MRRSISEVVGEVVATALTLAGILAGAAFSLWCTWCVVVGFTGGTYPLTSRTAEGSFEEGVMSIFIAPTVGIVLGSVVVAVVGGAAAACAFVAERFKR